MKVLLFDHNLAPYPVTGYGGIERTNQFLFEGLVDLGVDVELWVNNRTPYSYKNGKVKQLDFPAIRAVLSGEVPIEGFDVFHSHTSGIYQNFAIGDGVKWAATCQSTNAASEKAPNMVFVSYRQEELHMQAYASICRYHVVIRNGVDLDVFKLDDHRGTDIVWLGGIRSEKGFQALATIASLMGERIHVYGTIQDHALFNKFNDPDWIVYHGELIGDQAKVEMFKTARLMLHTAVFEEPGAFTIKEAQACGIPVVAGMIGCLPEEVIGERNMARSMEEMAGIVKAGIYFHDHAAIRRWAELHFDKRRMVRQYLEFWQTLI